jgi:transcriptional regulator with XRE-family HTH domain
MTTFGNLIRQYRIDARRTLKEAAELLKVSVVYVSEVELDKRPPFSIERIQQLARFYGINDESALIKEAIMKRGQLEVDISSQSPWQIDALAGLARGGITEEQWKKICGVIEAKGDEPNE